MVTEYTSSFCNVQDKSFQEKETIQLSLYKYLQEKAAQWELINWSLEVKTQILTVISEQVTK